MRRQINKKKLWKSTNPCRISCVFSDAWILDGVSYSIQTIVFLVRKYFFLKIYLTSAGEQFLTVFYTINLSPLLFTKHVFMLIIMLSNYQWRQPVVQVNSKAKSILTSSSSSSFF